MTKHFAAAFVAASALLAAASHGASARTTTNAHKPTHVVRRGHPVHASYIHKAFAHRGFAREDLVHDAGPRDTAAWVGETGTASYYSSSYNGRRSANGARFDQMELTAAHPWLPFGTKVRVMLAGSDRSVIVTITDRLASHHRVVDLSLAAARELGIVSRGVAKVTLTPV